MSPDKEGEENSNNGPKWAALGGIGVALVGAAATITVTIIGDDSISQADRPVSQTTAVSETVITTSTIISTPTSPSVSQPSAPSATSPAEDREYFRTSYGEFRVEGVVVWPASGPVRSAGEVKLGDQTGEAARCAVRIEYAAQAADGTAIGLSQERACPPEGPKVVWPKFGPVYFDEDPRIAVVTVTIHFHDDKTVTITCPRTDSCSE